MVLHKVGGFFISLDIDLAQLHTFARQLCLQSHTESAPRGREHSDGVIGGRGEISNTHAPSVQGLPLIGQRRDSEARESSPHRPTHRHIVGGSWHDADVPDSILDPLDEEQRAVAMAPAGAVIVRAGAGTGKTTAITHRLAYRAREGTLEPRHVMAVTFTNRAAGEMRERLRTLGVPGVAARTFHAAALSQLTYFWPRFFDGEPYRLAAKQSALLVEAARTLGLRTNPAFIRELLGEISWAKQLNTSPEGYVSLAQSHGREAGLSPSEVEAVYRAYEDHKVRQRTIDFDDVLLLCADMLDGDARIAAEVRDIYRVFTVDEFQDVSPVQFRLLQLWLGDTTDVCVVGDAAQTIYTFAGASDEFINGFTRYFPGATTCQLVRNYRSQPPIVEVANRVLASGTTEQRSLIAARSQSPTHPCSPRLLTFADEVTEAQGVAAQMSGLIERGVSPRDIAVLVRTRAQLPALEQACADVGLPIIVRGGERFFQRPEVREAITRLRGAARGGESMSGSLPEQVAAVLAVMGYTTEPPNGVNAIRQRWESLASLHALAVSMADSSQAESRPPADLGALVTELDTRAASQHAPQADAVTLATIHAAKGLQWSIVVVAGLAEGMLPFSSWTGDADRFDAAALAEEQRLFYVAVTRARDDLILSWSQSRHPGGRTRAVSRFVDLALPGASGARAGGGRDVKAKTGRNKRRPPATCRTCTTALVTPAERARGRCRQCPSTANEQMVERIRAWRLRESRRHGVPAFTVLTDATVESIAENRPETAAELAAISGIGPVKLDRYGDQLLALVAGVDPASEGTL